MKYPAASFVAIFLLASLSPWQLTAISQISELRTGARVEPFASNGTRGISITGAGSASAQQSKPAQLEFYEPSGQIEQESSGYDTLQATAGKLLGIAHIAGPAGSQLIFRDEWSMRGSSVELFRTVRVAGNSPGGFLSAITLTHPEVHSRSQVDYFAPGIIYGGTAHLSAAAIGGSLTYQNGGHGQVRIREDRLPAPLFGVRFPDGSSLTVLDPAPNGQTTRADSHDTEIETMIDERFRFGAIGADLGEGHHAQGFWFPGSEGEVTYRGNTYPGGQVQQWRRRYHPIRDGFLQQYRVDFRFSTNEEFPTYLKNVWRWAYSILNPPVSWQNIPVIRQCITDVLASQVEVRGDRAGIPNAVPAVPASGRPPSRQAVMGFTGKNLEAAEFLLADAQADSDKSRAQKNRQLGLAIFASFIRLKMDPPVGEGFLIDTGELALAIPRDHCVFLRSFGDDMKATLRAYRRERAKGIVHKDWLEWARRFGTWLLAQQNADGGFPRSWKPGTGEIADSSPQSSYNPVPFLVLLAQETAETRYLRAAERAADFVWAHGQSSGRFVGGTIDNPDVLDKEAGALSLEAYLALYNATHDPKWLSHARAAGDYAETWIYLWNVPMPVDADNRLLHWKKGVPTYGTQLIATGHSLVDEYMSYDVDEYAKLGRWTGDSHYLSIAKLLLHDTKNMVAIPGRTFDLKGPGWQQEHFSFAPVRGFGLHRLWLPWVATSQLNGIIELKDFDPALFQKWIEPERKPAK
ncbi:MAG TPA: hypothetical protein VFB14_26000 [Bryobacteraceae bacterium]|jgi:hypothetical protein|nr:hypothetical protein [Bryobacteraceae bacterium]